MSEWINRGRNYWSLNTAKVEAGYKAEYIGDFAILDKDGNWSDDPASVFWNEFPSKPEYSNYFGIFFRDKTAFICDARSVAEGHWNAVIAASGEIIYSRFRHDYRESLDGSAMVDGGRDYFKHSAGPGCSVVRISVIRDQLVVNDTLFFPVRDE